MRPAARQVHTFTLANPTAATWTFERFHTTCGCTVADISAQVVPPGGSAEVSLRYKPPTEPADDRRSVDVAFKESDAPRFRLTVAAKVRHPLTVLPTRVRLARLPYGKPHVERVTVEDYSGESLPAPKLVSNRDWLTVGTPEPLPANEPGMTAAGRCR